MHLIDILGIPRLSQYKPTIDCLSWSVKRRSGHDVSEVFNYLVASSDWLQIRAVNELSTTRCHHIERYGPLCSVCSISLIDTY